MRGLCLGQHGHSTFCPFSSCGASSFCTTTCPHSSSGEATCRYSVLLSVFLSVFLSVCLSASAHILFHLPRACLSVCVCACACVWGGGTYCRSICLLACTLEHLLLRIPSAWTIAASSLLALVALAALALAPLTYAHARLLCTCTCMHKHTHSCCHLTLVQHPFPPPLLQVWCGRRRDVGQAARVAT